MAIIQMANPVTGEAVERFRGKLRYRAIEVGMKI
jgi:hypothetical protein